MSKPSSSGRRKKLPVILLILLLLAAVLTFGRPAVVSVRYSKDDLKVRYTLLNPSFREAGYSTGALLDAQGHQATDESGTVTVILPILTSMNLGISSSFVKLAQSLPPGEYTLKVTLRYSYFGKEVSETVSCPFTVE